MKKFGFFGKVQLKLLIHETHIILPSSQLPFDLEQLAAHTWPLVRRCNPKIYSLKSSKPFLLLQLGHTIIIDS